MRLKLYCSSEHIPHTSFPGNRYFYNVMYMLWLLSKRGITTEIIDTVSLTAQELHEAYSGAILPSISKKHAIRRIFGSKARSGFRFGKEVPALLVYGDGEQHPVDVYPHQETQWDIAIIYEFLRHLLR